MRWEKIQLHTHRHTADISHEMRETFIFHRRDAHTHICIVGESSPSSELNSRAGYSHLVFGCNVCLAPNGCVGGLRACAAILMNIHIRDSALTIQFGFCGFFFSAAFSAVCSFVFFFRPLFALASFASFLQSVKLPSSNSKAHEIASYWICRTLALANRLHTYAECGKINSIAILVCATMSNRQRLNDDHRRRQWRAR